VMRCFGVRGDCDVCHEVLCEAKINEKSGEGDGIVADIGVVWTETGIGWRFENKHFW